MGRQRIRKKIKFKKVYAVSIILLIFLIGWGIYKASNFQKTNSYEIKGKIDVNSVNYTLEKLGNDLLVFEKGRLKIFEGEELKLEIERQGLIDPVLAVIKENIYLIDKDSGNIEVLNNTGETIKNFSIEEKIIGIKGDMSKQGISFHLRPAEDKEEIVFYDEKGENIGRTGNIMKGSIIDYHFDKENNKVILSAIEHDKSLVNNIMILNMNQKIQSGKILKDEIALKTFLGKNKDSIVATKDKIIVSGEDNKIKWEKGMEIDKIDYNYDLGILVVCKEGLDKTQVTILDESSNILYKGSISGKIKGISPSKEGFLLRGQRTIGLASNNDLIEIKFNKDVLWSAIMNHNTMAIGNNKNIEMIDLIR
ncbi:MAG: hypothetical protein WC996_00550 [Peptostreptococcales bacterium]